MAEPPRIVHDAIDPDLDPELVRLKRRVPVGPILAASVLGLALLLMWRLRAELAYAGQADTPADLGRATGPGPLVDGSFATLAGRPDAVAPARLRGAQEVGHRFALFVGTGGRIWLEDAGDSSQVTPATDDRWTGRLRRIDSTPYAGELARYLAAAPPVPRVVHAAGLGSRPPAADASGDPLALTPETRVAIQVIVPERARVLFVKTDDVPDEATARAALGKLGYSVADPIEKTDASWSWELHVTPDAVNAALRGARLFGAAASPEIETLEGRAAELELSAPDTIRLAGHTISRAAVDHATFWVKPSLADDAWVLISGDSPASLWYMRPLYAMLAVIALLMAWALVVDLRQFRRARPRPRLVA